MARTSIIPMYGIRQCSTCSILVAMTHNDARCSNHTLSTHEYTHYRCIYLPTRPVLSSEWSEHTCHIVSIGAICNYDLCPLCYARAQRGDDRRKPRVRLPPLSSNEKQCRCNAYGLFHLSEA
jgi:hypothetical protein